jgi:hypothetical protein
MGLSGKAPEIQQCLNIVSHCLVCVIFPVTPYGSLQHILQQKNMDASIQLG